MSALTIDVEDYFQVSGFEDLIPRASWGGFESRVERETDRLLGILDDYKVAATFFMLGWTAERHPDLVRRIRAAGHELACHSYAHRLVYQCDREEFREDTRRAKRLVEDLAGDAVIGYRAPSFSITRKSLWALEVLAEEGFLYDSSIFPILRDRYGIPGAPRHPFRVQIPAASEQMLAGSRQRAAGSKQATTNSKAEVPVSIPPGACCELPASSSQPVSRQLPAASSSEAQTLYDSTDSSDSRDSIVEFPPSTLRLLGLNFPIGGGGYLRLFPQWAFHRAVNHIVKREGKPAILYIHPWELDSTQPRFRNGSRLSRFRQYVNLEETEPRLRTLLTRWRFTSLRELLARLPGIPVRTL